MVDYHFLFPILLFLCLTVAGSACSAKIRAVLGSVYLVWLAAGLGLSVALLWSLMIYEYLIYPSYIDHIQPTIAAVSWLAVHGHPIWPNWKTGDSYGMIYGPLMYLVTGVFLLLNPSILMSKLPGLAALFGAIVCLWLELRRRQIDRMSIFLLIAAFLISCDPASILCYENRADSFLIFLAAATLGMAFEWPALRGAIGVGILVGLCAGFKAHGFLYAVPAALAVAARAKTRRECALLAVAGIVAAIAVIVLPFLVSQTANAGDYLRYLRMSTHHGLSMDEFGDGLVIAGTLAAPLLAVWWWRRPVLGGPERWFLIGLGGAVAATLVVAAKPGAGYHHLWPFYPACFYAMACVLGADSRTGGSLKPQNIMALVVMALLVTYAGWLEDSYVRMNALYESRDVEFAKIADVENILASNPDVQFGTSDTLHYSDVFYKVLAVFQGGPLHLDIPPWMDLAFAGIPESVVARAITLCTVRAWILPLGEPFTQMNSYSDRPLFSDEFREEFHNHYHLAQKDNFYQVWTCVKE
jgi:hypothetical protein